MKFAFRVDASIHIGSGHIMRCLVLALALKDSGHSVVFVCRPQRGDLIEFLRQRLICVLELNAASRIMIPAGSADYRAWLQATWWEDANEFVAVCNGADWVVVDHYGIGSDWELLVRERLSCKMLVLDDLVRQHRADVVLDQTLGRKPKDYAQVGAETLVLAGSDYALLKPGFAKIRELILNRENTKQARKLLLTMGGVDQPNATLKVLKVLGESANPLPTTVLLGPRAPGYVQVKEFAQKDSEWVVHHDFVEDIPALMAEHHVAVGAPGMTSWERACLGLPSIVIPLADNQKENCQQLVSSNAALRVELGKIGVELLPSLERLLIRYAEYRENNLRLCDGRGIYRLMAVIEGGAKSLNLRPATLNDIPIIYNWQKHPSTRKYALNSTVPEWPAHEAWMESKLQSVSDYFYIIELDGLAKGGLRLDRQSAGRYTVSIYVAPESYGQGIGRRSLEVLDMVHPDVTIHATVLAENLPSQRLFASAGYQRQGAEHFIRYPKV